MASKNATYDSLPQDQDRAELLSDTEVEESVHGDEKQWKLPRAESSRRQKRSTFVQKLRYHRFLIDFALFFVVIALLMVLVVRDGRAPSIMQVGGDFTGGGPQFAKKVVKFEADMEFAPRNTSAFFSDETLAKWNTIMPAGTKPGPADETFFTTSMTHQLHCLYMMARIFSGVTTDRTSGLPTDYHDHFLHCIDYLRQAVMCTADLALEAHDINDADDLGPLDGGWSGHHVCKDYGEVISYLEEQIETGVRVVLPIDD